MNPYFLARWQFAILTIIHFFFVPLTLGISVFLAILETAYVRTGKKVYRDAVKFWGKVFLINFALGVVSGIVQEFQFGLNWSEYARFMGDIFGAPLAVEALLAFYLESTFIGVWVFGWDKVSPKIHATVLWLTAIGSNLSAIWILIANSFMQHPTGYTMKADGSGVLMTNFGQVATNPNVLYQFPHVFFAGMSTAAFVVLGLSAYLYLKKRGDKAMLDMSVRWATIYGLIGVIMVITVGHFQGQFLVKEQPTKMAAAEALWHSEQPADFSLFAIPNESTQSNALDIKIPRFLSFLSYNDFTSKVEGIDEVQAKMEAKYGPGDYIPPVGITYWSFRLMVYAGLLMLALLLYQWYLNSKGISLAERPGFAKAMVWSILLPYLAVSTGWIMAEVGRQPWVVYGLLKTEQGVSPASVVSGGEVLFSLLGLGVVYIVLTYYGVKLVIKHLHEAPPHAAEAD